jgi:1-acyl-sn-glycerol-3-phosphate acyltransferase
MILPSSIKTVEDLLRHIGQKIDFLFIDAQTGRLRPDIEIIVNGKEIWFYPEGLRKPVHDKDSIEITLIPLGGG